MSYQEPNAFGSGSSNNPFNFGTGQPATNLPSDVITQYGLTEPQKSTVPFWDDPPNQIEPSNNQLNPWDVCVLGGIPLPGIARVNSKTHSRYQVKPVKNQNYQTITFLGYDPAEIIIENRIWTKVHLNMLTAQLPNLLPKFGPQQPSQKEGLTDAELRRLAIGVYHPSLALYGISALIILDIDILTQTSTPGVFQQKFHCLQYVPVIKTKKAGGTVTGAPTYTNINQAGLGQPRPATPPSAGNYVLLPGATQ